MVLYNQSVHSKADNTQHVRLQSASISLHSLPSNEITLTLCGWVWYCTTGCSLHMNHFRDEDQIQSRDQRLRLRKYSLIRETMPNFTKNVIYNYNGCSASARNLLVEMKSQVL